HLPDLGVALDVVEAPRRRAPALRDRGAAWRRTDRAGPALRRRTRDDAALAVSRARIPRHGQRGLGLPRPRDRPRAGGRGDRRARRPARAARAAAQIGPAAPFVVVGGRAGRAPGEPALARRGTAG